MNRSSRRSLAIGFALLLGAFLKGEVSHAQADAAAPFEFRPLTGSVSDSFSLFGKRLSGFPNQEDRLDLEVEELVTNSVFSFKAAPWVYSRFPDDEGGLSRRPRAFFEMKEGWAEYSSPSVDIRAGNQIFSWGAADQINPTDVLNPRDYYDIFQSVKLPIAAIDIKIHPVQWDDVTFEVVGSPFFRPSRLPIAIPDQGSYNFTPSQSRWLVSMPNGLSSGGGPVVPLLYQVNAAQYPASWQVGARMQVLRVGGWDFSLSGFNGPESLPRFSFLSQGNASDPNLPITIIMNPVFFRETMLGADGTGSVSFGKTEIGTRFEGAYFFRDNGPAYQQPAALQQDLLRDNYFHIVAGGDYTFQRTVLGSILYVNLQYVHYQRLGTLEQQPGLYVIQGLPDVLPWDDDLVLYWENRFGSKLKFSSDFIYSIAKHDEYISPSLNYSWTDNFKTALGGDFFLGNPNGFYGQFANNWRGTLRASLSF